MNRLAAISLLVPILLLAACDSTGVSEEWVSPQIRVSIVESEDGDQTAKSLVLLRVELLVRSEGGRDFSPEPVTVDNAVTDEVVFDVSIPPDSLYTFAVRFTSSGSLVGEGATIQEVTLETTVIDISVLETSTTTPSLAFLPSQIDASTGSGTIDIAIRLYGAGQATAGIAALFDITGPAPRPFVLQGSGDDLKINFVEGSRLNAAWQFTQDVQGVRDIGTLRLQRSQTADYCLEAAENNVRVVNRNGTITPARLLGTCVRIVQ